MARRESPTPGPSCPDPGRLADLLDEHVPAEELPQLHTHLEGCRSCQETLEMLAVGDATWGDVARRLRALEAEAEATPGGHADSGLSLASVLASLRALDLRDVPAGPEQPAEPDLGLDRLGASEAPGSLGRLGGYEVLQVLGRGGMGVVYKAFDPALRRLVALKALAPHLLSRPIARQRFLREARISAAIDHDNVVPLLAIQECGDVPLLVMQYVEGQSLQQVLDAADACPVAEVVRIGLQAARGLAAAHARGIIHRDVKPGNILLEHGSGAVKLTDFGLARTAESAGCTETGLTLGTPAFMSPEQAQGLPLDARSDLFSLGSVLYALCAARAPFGDGQPLPVLRRVCDEEPAPLRDLNPAVPGWLADLIARLQAKDASLRPASAAEVAEYLERGLAHLEQPDRVPPPGVTPRRRRRGRWLLAAGLLLAVSLSVSAATGLTGVLDRLVGGIGIEPEGAPSGTLAGTEGSTPRPVRLLVGHQGPVHSLAVTGDGRRLLSASGWPQGDGTIRLWDVGSATEVRRFQGHTGDVNAVALAPDGQRFLSASEDGTVRLWDLDSGKQVRCFEGHHGTVLNVVWSPDGNSALSCGGDGSIRLWDVATGKEQRRFDGHTDWVRGIALSPDGRKLLSGSRDGSLRLWDVATGEELRRFDLARGWVNWVTLTPDGARALVGLQALPGQQAQDANHLAALWSLTTGEEVRSYVGHLHGVLQMALSPEGEYVLTACYDGYVRLYDFETGRLLRALPHSGEYVWTVAFSTDGRSFFSAGGGRDLANDYLPGHDHVIRLWDLSSVLASARTR